MNFLLLTGAGFTRNWGGWLGSEVFEYLLGCPEVLEDQGLRTLLWQFADKGFEYALSKLQIEYRSRHTHENTMRLDSMEQAISRMFNDLNASIRDSVLMFPQHRDTMWGFLSRFHAIFTLNQDLWLETKYLHTSYNTGESGEFTWKGHELPGMNSASAHSPTDPA